MDIELDGKLYRVRPVRAANGQSGYLVSVQVRTRNGTTWRTLSGHGRAYHHETFRRVVAAYRQQEGN